MEKSIYVDELAEKELNKLSQVVEENFRGYLSVLEEIGVLSFPEARKVNRDLFEIRVQYDGSYRGFYAYVGKELIILLHVYRKKTQKAPIRNIKVAQQRLKKYK